MIGGAPAIASTALAVRCDRCPRTAPTYDAGWRVVLLGSFVSAQIPADSYGLCPDCAAEVERFLRAAPGCTWDSKDSRASAP